MKRFLLISLLLITGLPSDGQDIHFSQFPWSPLNTGAQHTAMFEGDLRLTAVHRRQWGAVTIPYKTFSGSADASLNLFSEQLKSFGAGVLINHDDAGDGHLRTLDFRFFFSARYPLSSDSVHFITGGLMTGYSQRSVDFNALSFDEQFNGDIWDPLAGNGENYNRNKTGWFDAGLGIGWEMRQENTRWHAGISAAHLNRPDQGFYSEAVRRPVLWQFTAGALLNVGENISLQPDIIWMAQEKFRALNAGAEIRWSFQKEEMKKYAVGAGVFYRFDDAVIPEIALYWSKIRLGISYDVNISPLRTVSNGRGGPEFSLTYITRKIRSKPQRSIVCPVY